MGKRGRRAVPIIFDENVTIGKSKHRIKITVDPRNFALDLSGSSYQTYSTTVEQLMKQVAERLGREALHNMSLASFANASKDIKDTCETIGVAIDKKLDIIAQERSQAVETVED